MGGTSSTMVKRTGHHPGSSAIAVAVLMSLTACGSSSGPAASKPATTSSKRQQALQLRNDTTNSVRVARCQANHCDAAQTLAAQATLSVRMVALSQGSAAEYLRIQTRNGRRCVLVPPATEATAGKTFYVSVSAAGRCD
jgi:hypothetical protein